MEDDRVVIAEILRSRGNKGEVLGRSQTDVEGRLENLKQALVRLSDGVDVPVEIESSSPYRSEWIFKFVGVNSITEADRFAHSEIWISRSERGELAEGDYFQSDLVGCTVFDRLSGNVIGPVIGWQNFGAAPLLEVSYQGRDVLVPLVDAICPVVDLSGKRILVELPEGLLDL